MNIEKAEIQFNSEDEFLTEAYALQQELTQHYQEMADCMTSHHNLQVADLFRQLVEIEHSQLSQITSFVSCQRLTDTPPWRRQWIKLFEIEHCMEQSHYLMSLQESLRLILNMAQEVVGYYRLIADNASDPGIKAKAEKFLAIKESHLLHLQKKLEELERTPESAVIDLDPPNTPE